MLSVLLHGLILAGLGSRKSLDRFFVPSPLQVRLVTAHRTDFEIPEFAEMTYLASLPAMASDIVVEGNGAGASPDDHLTPSPARAVATEEHYFQSIDLDEQPHPLQEVWLDYPAHVVALDLEGWVRLRY